MSIDTIRNALKSYRDFFDPGDEYCTCDPSVGYMCENCARRREATEALAALSTHDEAIRRECVGKVRKSLLSAPRDSLTRKYAASLAEQAILGAKPEKERNDNE